uniref:ATPase AAA-type core domain-containing protein n=1 Tax=Candidatus Kentrum sp. MB TaxID=2138164 RepID=A0A450XPW1_9GAMM|nr:MAG: hypothetical protein BECKMB1821G_GA0114241_102446 [Candidatus Kentron sp. MB]VFK31239.1 MAG: hypothetical protein BECKMB1821I_GA0114274_102145 [Candidatus Kentron sp. MB]VFK75412.1 MAG: hypothetical protein BECKMB1821H_GA0114242_102146 [Candidatus Kentron sp. MB]
MLIELAVANFRSIRDEQRVSLVAGRERIHRDANTFEPEQTVGARKRLRLLRSAALYGPNASGKTNMVRALATMRRMVLESQQQTGPLPMEPFLFDPETRLQPTLLEVVILVDGVRYQYGFTATHKRIHDEWLFAFPKGRDQRWFEREFFPDENREEFTFSDKLAGDKGIWRRATRPDALFLSTAAKLNSQQLLPLFHWFKDTLRVIGIGGWVPDLSVEWCRDDHDPDRKQQILRFLQAADFGITDVKVSEMVEYPGKYLDSLEEIQQFHNQITGVPEKKSYSVLIFHPSSDGRKMFLEPKNESDGTQKMFNLAAPWLDVLDQGRVLVVDELHDNLHPLLVQFLVRLFHSSDTNPKGAQLLFTTHETAILSDEYLRRDQIWFCERQRNQSTRIYSLANFKPPKGVENLEQDYLVGGYGAVPFLRNPSRIFED